MESYQKYIKFDKKLLIVGFGGIGQAVLPLIFRHIDIKPNQVTIITRNEDGINIAKEYGVNFLATPVTRDNYQTLIGNRINQGDFLLNLSVDVSSLKLIVLCQKTGTLYLDTCTE